MAQYDVVIIGGGPGGYNAAIRAGQLGLKAAMRRRTRATLGGTCLNVGCMPSKALLHASELFDSGQRASSPTLGIEVDAQAEPAADDEAEGRDASTALTKGIEFLFKKNKVDWIKGGGRIAGPGKVDGEGRGRLGHRPSETKNIVIATGSEPTPLPGVTVDQKRIVDSTGALSPAGSAQEPDRDRRRHHRPGAGLGLAPPGRRGDRGRVPGPHHARARTPRSPTTFQRVADQAGHRRSSWAPRSPARPPRQAGRHAHRRAGRRRRGRDPAGRLRAGGHRPSPVHRRAWAWRRVGIEPDKRGFIDTDHYKTSAPGVWAIGDVTHGPMLAHKAEDEAVACIELIAGKAGHVNYDIIPGVVYTSPEVAMGRQDRGGAEGRGRRLQGRQVPVPAPTAAPRSTTRPRAS